MNLTRLFIFRPVATLLLTLAILLAGALGYRLLPVAPLPQVDFPTIMVSASLAGASPETMAATVATPLERALGQIAGISEMTSSSSQGSSSIILQFELDRDINGAARDVQAAINAARSLLPSAMASLPTYRKANPLGRADRHAGADLRHPHAWRALRSGREQDRTGDGAGAGRWRSVADGQRLTSGAD